MSFWGAALERRRRDAFMLMERMSGFPVYIVNHLETWRLGWGLFSEFVFQG